MSNTAIKVANNTLYQFVGKLFTLTITVLGTILITRVYGREGYGAFSLMQSWPALVFIVVDFGLNAIATRELSKDFSKAGLYLFNIFAIRTVLSLIFIFAMWILLAIFPYDVSLKAGIRFSLFLILTQSLFTSANIIFQTKLRYDLSTISLIAGYIVILSLLLLFSYLKLDVIWLSITYVFGGIVTFLVSLYFMKFLHVNMVFSFDKQLLTYLFWQSLPLGIMFVFSQMNFKEDEILLSLLTLPQKYGLNNTESVALYALPYKIFEVALIVPTYLMNSIYPVLIKHLAEGELKLKATFKHMISSLILAAFLAAIVGFAFAPWAIKILGGESFSESTTVLRILVSGLIFYYLTQPLSWMLVTLEKQIYLPYIYFSAALVNLALNLHLIPRYSFYGAAVSTHLSELFILALLVIFVRRAWKQYYA